MNSPVKLSQVLIKQWEKRSIFYLWCNDSMKAQKQKIEEADFLCLVHESCFNFGVNCWKYYFSVQNSHWAFGGSAKKKRMFLAAIIEIEAISDRTLMRGHSHYIKIKLVFFFNWTLHVPTSSIPNNNTALNCHMECIILLCEKFWGDEELEE